MQATENEAKGATATAAAADLAGLDFDLVGELVDQVRAEQVRLAEQAEAHERMARQCRAAATHHRDKAVRALPFLLTDKSRFAAVMAEQVWDPILRDACPATVPDARGMSDKQIQEWLWAGARDDESPDRPALFRKRDGVVVFLGERNSPAVEGRPLVAAVRRVLGIAYPAEKPAKQDNPPTKGPAAVDRSADALRGEARRPDSEAAGKDGEPPKYDRATSARWNGWKGHARRLLGADWSEHAETFLRKLFEAGDKPAEAVATWRNEVTATEKRLFPDPLTLATFGDGLYTPPDFRAANSMGSLKDKGLIRGVLVDRAAANWCVAEVALASGEAGGIPAGVERYTLRRLVAPAHWRLQGVPVRGWVGRVVHDQTGMEWVIGAEVIEVDVAVEEGAGES